MQKIALATIFAVAIAAMATSALGAFSVTYKISNVGNVKGVGVGVYSDVGCTNGLSSINWGVLSPGTNKQFTVYLKNEGNVPLKLTLSTGNWNPQSAASYLTLNWDRQNYVLSPGSVVSAVLTLSVSSSTTGITSFSFEITITGTETT